MSNPLSRRSLVSDPNRPGEKCRSEPGKYVPVINLRRCEAKDDCIAACPFEVFEVRRIDRADYQGLDLRHRLKVRIHGMKMAYTPGAADCQACGLCVVVCPENAITLVEAHADHSNAEEL